MKKSLYSLIFGVFFVLLFSKLGYAQTVDDVGQNIVDSAASLPGLLAALCYLGGLIVAVIAIFKTVDHVNSPTQTPLSVPVIRYLLAGALFGLPIIFEAAWVTINGPGAETDFDPISNDNAHTFITFWAFLGTMTLTTWVGITFNSILGQIMASVEGMPGLVAAVGYLLGIVISVSALYKTRDHVEDPSRVPLKDAVIRYLTAGALFAMPTVFDAMYTTIFGTGMGFLGTITAIFAGTGFLYSTETSNFECLGIFLGLGDTLGAVICNSLLTSSAMPVFLNSISYLMGLVLGVWGVLKIRDHVIEPSRTAVSEGVMRLLAGGCFFSLPYLITVLQSSFLTPILMGVTMFTTNTGFNSTIGPGCGLGANSLDEAMGCFMLDIMGPAHVALNFFSFMAGTIFIMIGISRLIKSSQEGARGPGGIGTFGTFVIGGMLLSASTLLRAFSSSMFVSPVTYTWATLQFTGGMAPAEIEAIHNVISAVLQFLIVLGMISFVRGLFIMRDVAEGKGNASTMAGMTHLIGGALAVNMGPLLNSIQETLGITAFGVSFGL
ncbi:MAG: hypothetical protein KAJ29_00035 [Alphaproteobacteria bacterium]|nr:hypothetical protein [Alphaproteobacteria bacterium]